MSDSSDRKTVSPSPGSPSNGESLNRKWHQHDRKAESKAYLQRHPEKVRIRNVVTHAIRDGVIPPAKELICTDCPSPAARYDHYKGYEWEHRMDIQPVCVKCCAAREKIRQ